MGHLQSGMQRLPHVLRARQMLATGAGWREIGIALGLPKDTIYGWCRKVAHLETVTAGDLADGFSACGRKPIYQRLESDLDILKGHYLTTNRTEDTGSAEEAARIALREGQLSPGLTTQLQARIESGLPVLPAAIRRRVISAAVIVRGSRSKKNVDLDYFSAPGTMMWVNDALTLGREQFIRAGDILEADDATVNFPVVIPWEVGGDKCSDRWGVKVARFQWLVSIDAATRFVTGFNYTARPKSSYRAEDIMGLLLIVFRTHGTWLRCRFERGSWESNLVTKAMKLAGVQLNTVWSPHQKPFIEGLFNCMWTKLSTMPGQVGRFRGEDEEGCKLLTKCQSGSTDPRNHFPMLSPAINAFVRGLVEKNQQRVKSTNYGTWVPEERFIAQREEGRLRPLDESSAWMFSPCVREWTVDGGNVGGSVAVADGWSVRFDFGADWLPQFDGSKVRVHFDHAAPERGCQAMIVLAETTRDVQAGTVLGRAEQVNKTANYFRRVMEYGDDIDRGLEARKDQAAAVRHEIRAIRAGGAAPVTITSIRTATRAVRLESGLDRATEPAAERSDRTARPARTKMPLSTRSNRIDFEELTNAPAAARTTTPAGLDTDDIDDTGEPTAQPRCNVPHALATLDDL